LRAGVDSVSAEPLHPHRTSAQSASLHVPTDTAAGRPLRLRLRADTLPQDGLSRTSSRHASHTVTIINFTRTIRGATLFKTYTANLLPRPTFWC